MSAGERKIKYLIPVMPASLMLAAGEVRGRGGGGNEKWGQVNNKWIRNIKKDEELRRLEKQTSLNF